MEAERRWRCRRLSCAQLSVSLSWLALVATISPHKNCAPKAFPERANIKGRAIKPLSRCWVLQERPNSCPVRVSDW